MYGWGQNEELLGRALKGRRNGVVIVTKFGQTRRPGGADGVDGTPAYVVQACDGSLNASESMSSISTTSTGSIRQCRSRIRSAQCPGS